YDSLLSMVMSVSERVIRNRHIAEEVAQEVFLSVWQNAPAFDPGCAPARRWVSMVAHRRAVDRARSQDASHRRAADDARRSDRRDLIDLTNETGEHVHIERALERLPPAQREAIELVYIHGLTHTEVAAVLDVPLGTAKGRIRAGLASLRH